jgi:uncharacterized protein
MIEKNKNGGWILKALSVLLAAAVAGGFYFIYSILPEKVAQGIDAKAQVRQPLTRTPKDDGFAYKDVGFTAADGVTLSGWWMPPAGGQKALGTVLLSHGIFKNREQVLSRAEFLAQAGYQVLLFDHRGNGLSGKSPISGGLFESRDYAAAVEYLKASHRLRKPVVFFGFSMGAMSALRAAVNNPDLGAVIADGPLSNIKSYVSRRTIGGSFSSLPGFLHQCLADYDRITGLSLTEADMNLVPVVQQLHDVPVLYITGEGDDLAKSEEVRQLFAETPSQQRRLVYIQGAGHEETYKKSPMIYRKVVLEFLTDLRNGFPKAEDFPDKVEKSKKPTPHTQ